MKDVIFNTPWHWMRWLRLIIGISLLISLFFKPDTIMALFGGILLYQSLFNAGCGAGACNAPVNSTKKSNSANEEVAEFEEIK